MLTTSRFVSVMALVGLAALGAQAQRPLRNIQQDSLLNNHHIVYVGPGDETVKPDSEEQRKLIENFYLDQFENTLLPDAPYFLFMSRSGNMAMGFGGDVKLRAYYDPGNSLPGTGFAPFDIPMERDDLNRNHFATTPAGTALYFRLIGRNRRLGTYQVYIKAKFNGGTSNDFKLNKAYATVGDWTLGYATATFSDGAAEPPTVDDNGSTLSMNYTTLLVRYMHTFGKSGVSVAGAVESPKTVFGPSSAGTDTLAAARATSAPDIVAMAQYQWAPGQHIRLSGIMRWLPYRDLVSGRNHTPMGYGFQLSTVFSPINPVTVYGTFNCGRSYVNNSGDFLLTNYDLVGDATDPGHMRTLPSWSYLIGVTYRFNRHFFATCSFGQSRITESDLVEHFKYGLYGGANLFYNVTSRFQIGGEFSFGKRVNFDGQYAYGRRISVMAQFNF